MAAEMVSPGSLPECSGDASARQRPLVVGIGASAGGLESLKLLLPGLPTRLGLTYVVLQHLAPTHRSLLAEILSSRTQMPVREIRDGDPLAPDEVLITPPNAHVEFDGQRFRLTQPEPQSLPRPSINLFFTSLAERLGPRAVGVILSGTGSDGAIGLRQIRAAGGYSLIQQPNSARYNGMPEAAIRAVGHDRVLTPEELGPALQKLCTGTPELSLDSLAPKAAEDRLQELIGRVRRRCGIDFGEYKEGTLLRRITRRMQARDVSTLDAYLEICAADPSELDQMARDTLISVTSFWRDREAFNALALAIDDLVQRKPAEEPLRVWVAGCATGEEAYSIAIAFAEALGESLTDRVVQIFATDLDQEALTLARRGLYPATALSELRPELVQRHFMPVGAQLEVSRMLRERVVFSRHDLTRDPPFPRLDLVSCRNVLIYLKQEAQSRILRTFHYALWPRGLLFLGHSESVLHHENLFTSIGTKDARLYERNTGGGPLVHAERPFDPGLPVPVAPSGVPPMPRRAATPDPEIHLLRLAAELYLPPSVLIDERLQVLQIHGDISPFFTLRSGTQTFDVLSLARTEIESELRVLCALLGDSQEVRHSDVVIGKGRQRQIWRMQLHPFSGPASRRRALLVFVRRESRRGSRSGELPTAVSAENELADARERLKSLVEQLEASNEEMQALNEEAQATNEELQASNEELESANEEMQATNQELATVNAELQHQWRRYQQLSEELQSIQNSIDLPLLVIDTHLGIRRFNEAAARLFRLSPGCEGLHLSTMSRPVGMPDLVMAVTQAQASASSMVVHLPTTEDGREYVLHLAHNVLGSERRGMVLTLVDNTELAQAERHTRSVEQRLLAVMTHGSALVAVKDAAGRYEFANDRYTRFFDLAPGSLAGRTDHQCLPAPIAARLRQGDIEILRDGQTVERDEIFDFDSGRRHWWVSRFALFDDQGAVVSVCIQAVDLTRWRATDEQLRIASRVIDVTSEGVIITDPDQRIVRVNQAFTRITGFDSEEAIGRTPRLLASGRHDSSFYAAMWQQIRKSGFWQGEILNKRKTGEVYPQWLSISVLTDERQQITHYVGVFSDISELAESQERIRLLATHDTLTGLPNRALLLDRLEHALDAAQRHRQEVALCFIDLDDFKAVNDSLGHDVGDELLRIVARRILDHVRQSDTLARIGGDEFVLLLENTSRHECLQTIERLSRALAETVMLRENLLTTAASIGIAVYPSDAQDAATLMRNADAAMYRAKRSGRSRYEFFSSEVGESARARLELESGLRQALQEGELFLEYQPQVDIPSGCLCGVEALLRWRTSSGQLIAPSVFLPIAEETALIDLIGNWVLNSTFAQLAEWRRGGLSHLSLSVNVSPRQLRDRQFPERLQSLLLQYRVPPERIVLEITESAVLQLGEGVRKLLGRLHALGFQLSLDDFGTGYSSLAHLRQLPLDELKIDRSFVSGMLDRRDDREIVAAVMGLAGALGLRVVAEGVENVAQFEQLGRLEKPPRAQGFHVAVPMSVQAFAQWVSARPVCSKSPENLPAQTAKESRDGDAHDPG